jgi:serine/threonine protein phosphatase 1
MSLTYAIGDIHGRYDLLQILLHRIRDHAGGNEYKLVFLGDYIDRGPESAAVVECVRAAQAQAPETVVCLKGNHEDMLLSVIDKPALTSWWIGNGGEETLVSFGVLSPRAIPTEVMEWFRSLPVLHEDERRYYVHAGLRPGRPVQQQTEEDMLWIREPFLDADYDFGKHVVHGHTPLPSGKPKERPFRTNLDTGAVFNGALTAGIFSPDQGPAIGFLEASHRPAFF